MTGNNWGDQPIPYSPDAEEAALGAAIIGGAIRAEAILLTAPPDNYFLLRNQYVAQAIATCLEQKLDVDYLTVSNALTKANRMADIGGPAYLTHLINNVTFSPNALSYAKLVAETATRRRLMAAADEVKAAALDETKPLADALNRADTVVRDVQMDAPAPDLKDMKTVMNTVLDRVEKRIADRAADNNPLAGLSSGIPALDEITNGFQPAQFILFAGRPGMGKTAGMTYFATHVAELKPKPDGSPYRVLFVTLEMTIEQLGRRMLSAKSGVPGVNILQANLSAAQNSALIANAGELAKLQIYMWDGIDKNFTVTKGRPNVQMTPSRLRREIQRFARKFGALPDEVFVDYIQLMRADGRPMNNRAEEISLVSRGTKECAREFNLPIIAGAQLNRGVDERLDKHPVISDLRESGSLEQDGDVIIFPYFEPYYDDPNTKQGYMEFGVGKNRDGSTGTAKEIWADFYTMQFYERPFGV